MRVHFTGISGTGMGALALLFREAGHEVRGSDMAFDPPIGPALENAGIPLLRGYAAANLDWGPELTVVGNAIRKDNPEATRLRDEGLRAASMSGALRELFLTGRRAVAICGTHGKTTTSAMVAHLLRKAELDPGWFIGGVPKNLPAGAAIGRAKRGLLGNAQNAGGPSPFVIEGDEYDAVYWHKKPKFLDYVGVSPSDIALVTSIEHDHIDIYPDLESYLGAFRELAAALPEGGLFVGDASDAHVREVSKGTAARCVYYALQGDDTGDVTPTWLGAPSIIDDAGNQLFDLYAGGVSVGRFGMKVPGAHNIRNAVGALAVAAEGFGVPFASLRAALGEFQGVRRRQDLLGEPGGVRVYDDFAHHPTAVLETLRALRSRHPKGKLFAVFEPRSATACRAIHQTQYVGAFGSADRVLLAPLGRTNVPEAERLDTQKLAHDLGTKASAEASVDTILATLLAEASAGDTVALLSNGAFGGIYTRLMDALKARV